MKIKGLLLVAALSFATVSYSQEYLEMIDAGTFKVQEVIDNAEAYFENRDKGRGTGYKQFKRWEYMAKRLQNDAGYLVSIDERIEAYEERNAKLNQEGNRSLNDNWQELGPTDYIQTSGWNPGVGRITGLAIDGANEDHMIISANTGGIWQTTDSGANWTPLSDNFSNLYSYAVAMDPTDSSTYFFGSNGGKLFKSTDSGATWNELADLGSSIVNQIVLNPTNTDIIFASLQNQGLYRSTDGGATWDQVTTGGSYDVEFKPGDTQTVYAGGTGVWLSTDGGANFTSISGFNGGAKMLAVSADDPSVVYVVDENNGSSGGVWKSADSGASYTELGHTNRNYFGYDTNGFQAGGQAPRDMAIAVNPNNADEVHIAGVLTWRSDDGGLNFANTADWQPGLAASQNKGYHHPDVDDMLFYSNTSKMYVISDGGIFRADTPNVTSSTMYTDLTFGLGIHQYYKIGVSQTADVVVTGGSQDNGSFVYSQANSFRHWLGADGMEGFVDKDNPNILLGTSQFGNIYRSTNGGASAQGLNRPEGGNWVTPYEQDPTDSNVIYFGGSRVYKSLNLGSSWSPISQSFGGDLDEMKLAPTNNQIIYASRGGTLFKTTDGGATAWVQMTNPGGLINSMAVHPTDPDKIAVAVTSGTKVRLSEDGGATWSTINSGELPPAFASLAIAWDGNSDNGLYVGLDYGIYYIDDNFSEWQLFNNGIPNVIVNELEVNQVDGNIYAGTYGRGLWVSPKYDSALSVQDFLAESNVALYPNPTNTEVTIALQEAVVADVRVFDMSGKLVIFQKDVTIGNTHRVNVSALTPGVYFIRLNTEFGSITKKLMKN